MGGDHVQDTKSAMPVGQSSAEGWWPKGWWSIVDYKIGIVPLPIFVILLAVPMGAVCQPDCAGICFICGGNRNLVSCDCEEKQRRATSKLSALKDLKV